MNYFFCDVLKTLSSVKTYHYNAWYPIKQKRHKTHTEQFCNSLLWQILFVCLFVF